MKTLLALFLSITVATAVENYFVIETDGTLSNIIVANADFSPGAGKTKALISSLPAGAKVGDKWDGSTLTPGNTATQQGIKDFLASYGYDEIALLNLVDIQARLKEANVELPTKAEAVREWITATQIAYANGQAYAPAPYTYAEVLAELAPLITQ